jgi:uncharacterized protein involved in exopolysaccharide biosynthesis/Mrp family chromosome partitioning ATPase
MASTHTVTNHSNFGVDDFLFAAFKHKWKILLCTTAGVLAAIAVYVFFPIVYESQAKLLVRYVLERSTVDPIESTVGSSGSGKTTDTVINSEVEILTSWDLAVQVAEAIGAKRLLPDAGPGATATDAAVTVKTGLEVSSQRGSNIIFVSYKNARPELTTLVLDELVARYFTKHLEVHRSAGAFDFVTQQTDQLRSRLNQTEDALRALKSKIGVVSLKDSTNALSAELARIQDELRAAEAERAVQQARVKETEGSAPKSNSKAKPLPAGEPTSGIIQHYQALVSRLAQLRATELELLSKYTPGNVVVKLTQTQIADLETQRHDLEKRFPDLPGTLAAAGPPGQAPATEKGRLGAMEIRCEMLRLRVRNIQEEMKRLSDVAAQIEDLERTKELEEGNYKYFEATLQKARVDEALDPSKMPNISAVQKPSPAMRVVGKRDKIVTGLAVGGLALGLSIAFLTEMLFSRTIKRPLELEKRLRTLLLLSIPDLRLNGHSRLKLKSRKREIAITAATHPPGSSPAPWESDHFVRPYCEAIRDRFGLYFERNRMTHKPKLIGVAGFKEGAGVSTLAAGLAAAFSEMGDGKVLLVDANLGSGEIHPFFKGRPAGSLMNPLELAKEIAPTADNLYLATVAPQNDTSTPLGLKKFFELMPNLKASNFDYIIFDMPPLGQTSPTFGMAGFMDKLLLVVEAEKNDREVVRRGYAELVAGHDNVSVVFNKARSYGPKWINGES